MSEASPEHRTRSRCHHPSNLAVDLLPHALTLSLAAPFKLNPGMSVYVWYPISVSLDLASKLAQRTALVSRLACFN